MLIAGATSDVVTHKKRKRQKCLMGFLLCRTSGVFLCVMFVIVARDVMSEFDFVHREDFFSVSLSISLALDPSQLASCNFQVRQFQFLPFRLLED